MGLFGGKRRTSESLYIDELLDLSDREIDKILRDRKSPVRSARELRKMAKDDQRRVEGERGLGALIAGLRGGGTGNRGYDLLPLHERVHPARYKQLLEQNARKNGWL